MSRVGRSPIALPSGVDVSLSAGRIAVKGPQGSLERALPGEITVRQEDDILGWLLGWGARVRVLEPESLRRRTENSLKSLPDPTLATGTS